MPGNCDYLNQSLLDVPFDELGLLGDLADFIYHSAPHPNRTMALLGSLIWMATITSRPWHTWTGAGLNLNLLVLAGTGRGKEQITSGRGKLDAAIARSVPAIYDFHGPNLVSAAGAIKALDKFPAICVNMAEAGYKLEAMTSPRANVNDKQLKGFICDAWGKSGIGGVLEPNGNVDAEKSAKNAIFRPCLSILAESVPSIVYAALDERAIYSGLLSRFITVEVNAPRAPLSNKIINEPWPQLTQKAADLASMSLGRIQANQGVVVDPTQDAFELFRDFDAHITNAINKDGTDITAELYNRVWLNAQKIACIIAIGINPHAPLVTHQIACWATNFVSNSADFLIGKFKKNEVGVEDGDESKQISELIKAIKRCLNSPYDELKGYKGLTPEMQKQCCFTQGFLSRYLMQRAAFKNDKRGATAAIRRAVQHLQDSGHIRLLTPKLSQEKFGTIGNTYMITNTDFMFDES